ncbi:MAG: Flavobacterium phage 11b, partial [Bacteroidota bacterium]
MAINPSDITTVRVDQLSPDVITLSSLLPHQVGTELKQGTIQELVDLVAAAVGAGSGVGFLPISVTNGQQLPDVPENPSFFLCGAGTFLNINGYPDVICTGELNAVMSLSDHWGVAVEIPIVAEVGVQTVTGSAVDNSDPLNPVINSTGVSQDLQEVMELGRNYTQSVGDYTYVFGFIAGNFTIAITHNTTGILNTYTLSDDESFEYIDDPTTLNKTIGIKKNLVDGFELFTFNDAFGTNKFQIPYKTSGTGDAIFQVQNNLPAGTYELATLDDIISGGFTVISTNTTASNDTNYSVVANATFTDPSPIEGKGYVVFVRNGTATIGGVGYTAGRLIYRFFHSGAWGSTVFVDKVYVDAKVTDAIVDGVTTVAPSQNAVFDALALKENTITAGTSAQYYRGDKTFQTLNKTAVGLNNVDNTSDANKPVSTDTQTQLNTKQTDLFEFDTKQGFYLFEDFLGDGDQNSFATGYGFMPNSSGTGAVCSPNITYPNRTNQQGVIQLGSGTTATGSSNIRL